MLKQTVDFTAVRAAPLDLFIGATDVRAGRQKVFERRELSAEVVLASSALPYLFQAIEVEGQAYWDGGYMANPPLWPLFYGDMPDDILLVMLNPVERKDLPRTAGEIVDRLNEITFNASLAAELRAVAFVQKLVEEGLLTDAAQGRYRRMLIHAIEADGWLDDLPLSSKFDTEWNFLLDLKDRGRRAAEAWLQAHGDDLGVRSTLDIRGRFL